MQLPHLATLRAFTRARCILARKALAEGKIDEAMRQIRLAYAIPLHLDDQPFLIEGLVSIACDSIILQSVEELLVSGKRSREQLETLAKVLDKRRACLGDGTRAFLGEELGSKQAVDLFLTPQGLPDLTIFEVPGRAGIERTMWLMPTKLPGTRAFRILFPDQTMKAQIGRYFEGMRTRLKQPYFLAFGAAEEEDPLLEMIPRWNLVARMFLPVLRRAPTQYARRKVCLDIARVAVALKRTELDGHRRPERLDELVPKYLADIPVDELSGKPLHYSPRDGGWRVWSVGRDFKDDGGTRKDWGGPDLVFFVEEAPGRLEHIRENVP
jgi:hypothetical protein